MASIRIDPWQPQYGPDVEFLLGDDGETASLQVDTTVESSDWTDPIRPREAASDAPLVFVDGVRRVEVRVVANDGDRSAPGLLGAYGVGAVLADGDARWLSTQIGRAIVLGDGMTTEPLSVNMGGDHIEFLPISVAGADPVDPLRGLQKVMREAEASLAVSLTQHGMVLADGPLAYAFAADAPVVGVVKRSTGRYLPTPYSVLLERLVPGERTPLFALGDHSLDRYAWYQRLVPNLRHWHPLAALIRCEVRTGMGIDEARATADQLAMRLSRFAGRVGFDPRAPQNLAPVGALESKLRHLLGDSVLIRRRLELGLLSN